MPPDSCITDPRYLNLSDLMLAISSGPLRIVFESGFLHAIYSVFDIFILRPPFPSVGYVQRVHFT